MNFCCLEDDKLFWWYFNRYTAVYCRILLYLWIVRVLGVVSDCLPPSGIASVGRTGGAFSLRGGEAADAQTVCEEHVSERLDQERRNKLVRRRGLDGFAHVQQRRHHL